MQSQLNEISPVMVEIGVEIPWEKINKDLEEAYSKLQRSVRVRGFRPGKVPRHVVRQLMGKTVKQEVTATLVQEGIEAAVREHSLEPVAIPSVDHPTMEEGNPLIFSAKLEIRPRIESVDISSLEIERVSEEVNEEAVSAEIETMRERSAELVTPEPPRPSTKGDILTVDYNVYINDEKKEELSATDRQIEIGKGHLLPELEEGLIGLTPGVQKKLDLKLPEDLPREDLRGASAIFEVTVKELREKVLPDIDDELAKDHSYDSLETMKSAIRERLQKTARQRSESKMRELVLDCLVEKNPIPVPPTMLQQQQQAMMRELQQFQRMLGREEAFDDEVLDNLKERAERKVRAGLLLSFIARREKMEINEGNIEEYLQEIAENSGKHIAKVRADYQGEKREILEAQLMEKKLIDYLMSEAKIKEAEPLTNDTSEEAQK